MYCKYCGNELPEGGVCNCEDAVKERENLSLNSEYNQEEKDIYTMRVETIAIIFGQNKFKIAGILLVIYSVIIMISIFSLFSLINIIPLLFGIFIIAFSTQTKGQNFQISGEDTLKKAHLTSFISMIIGIIGIVGTIIVPAFFMDEAVDYLLSDYVAEQDMLIGYEEYSAILGEEIVIDEYNREEVLNSAGFGEYVKLSLNIVFVMLALVILVFTLFMLFLKKTINRLKQELSSKEWSAVLRLGSTGFLNFIGGFAAAIAILSIRDILFALITACLSVSMFLIARVFKEYNDERNLLTQRVLTQDHSQSLEQSSL